MSTPQEPTAPAPVALDHIAALIEARDQAAAEVAKWEQALDVLNRRIQAEMGQAREATAGGRPAFTWRPTGRFAEKRFRTEQPEVAEAFTVLVPAIDTKKLAAEHPELFEAYRGRVFLRKGGAP